MKTINQLLQIKGRDIHAISPDASVFEAIVLMADKQIGALVVTQGERPVGLISERDYARKVILEGRSSRETAVRQVMSEPLICVRPEHRVEEAMALMTDKRVRHLPVVENGGLVGLISIGDLVKAIIDEQQFIIEQLEHYIAS